MDQRISAISADLSLRIVATDVTHTLVEAMTRQGSLASEKVLLGRILAAASSMASIAKRDDERVRIQMIGAGPVEQVLADAHGDGRLRACVKSPLARGAHAHSHAFDTIGRSATRSQSIAALLGDQGSITVVRDIGLSTPYEGSCNLTNGEIDEDLEHYLNQSEQLPSVLACETALDARGEVVRAIGLLIQTFPDADLEGITAVRARLRENDWLALLSADRPLEDFIGLALDGKSFDLMGRQAVKFACPCGKERAISVLSALGAEDLEALADEQQTTSITCNFCGKIETVGSAEVRRLAQSLRNQRS
jgi:molecular chaperone Hsp33